MKTYYKIDEDLARRSKESYSFNDYIKGSATIDYQKQVDYAYELVEKVLEENKEKAFYYVDMYAKKLANNINKRFSIDISCPSVMITGAGNFPMKKKQRQMERLDKSFKEYEQILTYLDKIKSLKNQKIKTEKQGTSKNVDLLNDYFTVFQNEELNRLQLSFEYKPIEEQRMLLKKNGFKWSPKNQVWQRQLTDNALFSTKKIIDLFNDMTNEKEGK